MATPASGRAILQGQQVQGRHRLGEALEIDVADGFDLGEVFNIGVDALGKQDLAGLFGGKVGKGAVSRAWRKVKSDWESWQTRGLR